jgi:hypothetical protein
MRLIALYAYYCYHQAVVAPALRSFMGSNWLPSKSCVHFEMFFIVERCDMSIAAGIQLQQVYNFHYRNCILSSSEHFPNL